jgi:hypothetical protein
MAALSTYAIATTKLYAEAGALSNSDGFVRSVSLKNPRKKLLIKLLQKLKTKTKTMDILKISQKHIDLFLEPKDCFFYTTLHLLTGVPDGQSDKVELPIAGSYSRFLTLVRDAEGGCHWVFANQVAIRGQNHSKGYLFETYTANCFDWTKINNCESIIW